MKLEGKELLEAIMAMQQINLDKEDDVIRIPRIKFEKAIRGAVISEQWGDVEAIAYQLRLMDTYLRHTDNEVRKYDKEAGLEMLNTLEKYL